MKATTYMLLIFLILCCSCTQKSNYQITGTVADNSLNGEYVYLQRMSGNELISLDSARVNNKAFSFRGIQDKPELRELNFSQNEQGKLSPLVFVLQEGSFEAFIDTVSYLTGSEENDRLHDYFNQFNYYDGQIRELVARYDIVSVSDTIDDSLQVIVQRLSDSIEQEMNQISYKFIIDNRNSVSGGLVFLQAYPNLYADQIDHILHVAGADFRSVNGVEIVEKQVLRERQTAVGKPYVNFSMTNPRGETVSLDELAAAHTWILLDFWASWCLPCFDQIPVLQKLHALYPESQLQIVSISLDMNSVDWHQSIERNKLPWLQLSDLKGWDCSAAQLYGIQTLPYNILIDPSGIIVAKGISVDKLQERIVGFISGRQKPQ